MNKTGPIVIIEDDEDDQQIISEVLKELNYTNEVIFFQDSEKALDYLMKEDENPFLILSDINMPKLSGFELREKVYSNEQLKLKCIPYIFFTTAASQQAVIDAYSKSVQGFFVKPASYGEIKRVVGNIIRYWQDCHSPNKTA
jgi:CheY-like chemotaxis protein